MSAAANGPFGTLRVVVEPEEQQLASPLVLAVVVTHGRHADRFKVLLGALAEQDYPDLSVLVIDTAVPDDTADRVRAAMPTARVLHVPGTEGFGAAANHVLDHDRPRARRAEFFAFCRDDVLPDPGAVSALVGAATEWDADVVGPKFVARDDPRRLLHVGLGVDRVGTTMPLVERRELDPGQHDGVREVFAFPAGFTLVRADRFTAVAGFDEAIGSPDDDLGLCWRARAAGSRVVVATDARVRRDGQSWAGPRDQARYRVRALLSCSSRHAERSQQLIRDRAAGLRVQPGASRRRTGDGPARARPRRPRRLGVEPVPPRVAVAGPAAGERRATGVQS